MKAVVAYESMYGNTHLIAEEIGRALAEACTVEVLSLDHAGADLLAAADLVVVGGPTHAHGMSHAATRKSAVEAVAKDDALELDPDAPGEGIRDWLASLPKLTGRAAAFDTRIDAPAALTGRASKGIAKRLHKHGFDLIAEPESFLVTKQNQLEPGEIEHAHRWGAHLATVLDTAGHDIPAPGL